MVNVCCIESRGQLYPHAYILAFPGDCQVTADVYVQPLKSVSNVPFVIAILYKHFISFLSH